MAKPKRKQKVIEDNSTEEQLRVAAKKNMEDLLAKYNKRFKGNSYSVQLASEFIEEGDVAPLSTRHISFDLMTGIGGLPVGKIIEFTGEEGCHKSNFAWECVGAVHKENDYNFVVWIDGEKAVDLRVPMQRKHISNMGVDFNRLIIIVPDSAEQCWSAINEACENETRLVVIDSISSLIPNKELKAGVEADGYPALPASINRGFRGISKNLWTSGTTLIEINQVREALDLVNPKYTAFEDKWKTTGGKGLKHWLTLRLFFRKKKIKVVPEGSSDNKKVHIGDEVSVKVIKTRLAPIMDDAKMFMYHKTGFDAIEELMAILEDWELLYKESPRAKKMFLADAEDDLGAMTWDEWYEYFQDEECYNFGCDIIKKAYNEYYSEDNDIIEDLEEQEEEYEDYEDEYDEDDE